uniref:Uncharacterized protein n=1 Tax=Lepeophtheirus salmonis TaxID=72036 RepID=A0A0K2U5Q3_LEPSM
MPITNLSILNINWIFSPTD